MERWEFRIRYGEGQERWLDGHENEWKSATDGGGGHLQDETETWDKGGAQKLMGSHLSCDSLHWRYGT